MITIILNGEEVEVANDATVADLLARLEKDPRAVAIELNGAILPREQYGATALGANDRLEVVQFVQGGSQALDLWDFGRFS